MKLYCVRHGQSEANVNHEFANRGRKNPLTEKGREQAKNVAENLNGIRFHKVYSSPLLRAQETADIITGILGLSHEPAYPLIEFDVGIIEGRFDKHAWELMRHVWDQWFIHEDYHYRVDGGESLMDIQNRFLPFIRELINTYTGDENILLIGHGGTFVIGLPLVVNNLDHQFVFSHWPENCAQMIVEFENKKGVCTQWCSHLFC